MQQDQINNVSAILKSISHPLRLSILCLLLDGEKSVGDIQSILKTTNANISQHLSILRNQNILSTRKDANYVYNSIADQRVVKLIDTMRGLFCTESGGMS